MPANKSAIIRYKILDECHRQSGYDWTLEQLTDHVSDYLINELGYSKGISKSSIEKDLLHMKSSEGYYAPIEMKKRLSVIFITIRIPGFQFLIHTLIGMTPESYRR